MYTFAIDSICVFVHTASEKFIMSNKLGRIGLNENKLKWMPFWSNQLKSTAKSAHFRGESAELAVLFSW